MKTITAMLLFITSNLMGHATPLKTFTERVDAFLKKYVSEGLIDYSKISQNSGDIEKLYLDVGTMDLNKATANEQKAFYINAYNIVVIYSIVRNYPVASPMDVKGFFDKTTHDIAAERLTLNELENQKLRQIYNDGRLHFALVCAAKSCPPLAASAFTPDKIEGQLNERTRFALNDNTWIKVHPKQKKVEVSQIFEWYKDDFASTGSGLINWINQFRIEKIPVGYTVSFYEYDWSLNKR
jgi:hypothetical protein